MASRRKAAVQVRPAAVSRDVRSVPNPLCDTIAVAAIAAAIAASSLLVDPRAEAAFEAPKRFYSMIAIAVATVFIFSSSDASLPRLWPARRSLQSTALVLFVVAIIAAVVSAMVSPRRAVSVGTARAMIIFLLLVPIGASRILDAGRSYFLLAVFIAASAINAILSILQAVGLYQPFAIESIGGRVASFGLIGNEGYLGLLMALAGVASLGVATWASARSARVAGLVGLGLFLVALALTRNVSGWIALIAGTIPLLRARLGQRRIQVWAGIFVTIVIAAFVAAFPMRARISNLAQKARAGEWNSLLSYRLSPWAAAVEMIRDRPLVGFGPGTFGAEFVSHRLKAEIACGRRFVNPYLNSAYFQAHCDYLQAFAEAGIPAGVAAIGAFAMLIAGLARSCGGARNSTAPVMPETSFVLGVLCAGAAAALTWSALREPALAVPLMLAAGRGWRLMGHDKREDLD